MIERAVLFLFISVGAVACGMISSNEADTLLGTEQERQQFYETLAEASLSEPAVKLNPTRTPFTRVNPVAGGLRWTAKINTKALASRETASPISTNTPSLTATPTDTHTATPAPIAVTSKATAVSLPRLAQTRNILVLGSDRREREPNWRTDVIMILALDLEEGQAGVVSFPRDIYMEYIPGHRPNRINVVDYLGELDYPGGGPKLLGDLLSQKLAIPIHNYVRFEFESFRGIVDSLGGIDIAVDCTVFDEILEEDLYVNLAPGVHRLNGRQALAYVRSRRNGGDLERIRRQQRLVWAMRNQFRDQNWLPKVATLYHAFSNNVDTDLSLVELLPLARFALSVREENVHGLVISPPGLIEPTNRYGMFLFIADWPSIAQAVQSVFDRPPFDSTNTIGPSGDSSSCS